MRSYPIWHQIQSCIYANNNGRTGNKSYGTKQHSECQVKVGSSASNSHDFIRHETTHRQHNNGDREFHFYIDGAIFRKAILRKGSDQLVITFDALNNSEVAA